MGPFAAAEASPSRGQGDGSITRGAIRAREAEQAGLGLFPRGAVEWQWRGFTLTLHYLPCALSTFLHLPGPFFLDMSDRRRPSRFRPSWRDYLVAALSRGFFPDIFARIFYGPTREMKRASPPSVGMVEAWGGAPRR